jgi:hypothetical protein
VGFHSFNPLFNSTFQRSNLNDHNSTFPSHFLSTFISFSNSVIQFEQPHDSIIDSLICFSIFQNPNKFDYSDWNSLQDHLNPFAFGTIFCFCFRINLPIWKTSHQSILHSLTVFPLIFSLPCRFQALGTALQVLNCSLLMKKLRKRPLPNYNHLLMCLQGRSTTWRSFVILILRLSSGLKIALALVVVT